MESQASRAAAPSGMRAARGVHWARRPVAAGLSGRPAPHLVGFSVCRGLSSCCASCAPCSRRCSGASSSVISSLSAQSIGSRPEVQSRRWVGASLRPYTGSNTHTLSWHFQARAPTPPARPPQLLDRRTELKDPPVANADRLVLCFAVRASHPPICRCLGKGIQSLAVSPGFRPVSTQPPACVVAGDGPSRGGCAADAIPRQRRGNRNALHPGFQQGTLNPARTHATLTLAGDRSLWARAKRGGLRGVSRTFGAEKC